MADKNVTCDYAMYRAMARNDIKARKDNKNMAGYVEITEQSFYTNK